MKSRNQYTVYILMNKWSLHIPMNTHSLEYICIRKTAEVLLVMRGEVPCAMEVAVSLKNVAMITGVKIFGDEPIVGEGLRSQWQAVEEGRLFQVEGTHEVFFEEDENGDGGYGTMVERYGYSVVLLQQAGESGFTTVGALEVTLGGGCFSHGVLHTVYRMIGSLAFFTLRLYHFPHTVVL